MEPRFFRGKKAIDKAVLKCPVLVFSQEATSRWWCDEHVFHSNADLCPLYRWENWGYICNQDPKGHPSPRAWPAVTLPSLVPSPSFLLLSFLLPLAVTVSAPFLMWTQGTRGQGAFGHLTPKVEGPRCFYSGFSAHSLSFHILEASLSNFFFQVNSSWKEWNKDKYCMIWLMSGL